MQWRYRGYLQACCLCTPRLQGFASNSLSAADRPNLVVACLQGLRNPGGALQASRQVKRFLKKRRRKHTWTGRKAAFYESITAQGRTGVSYHQPALIQDLTTERPNQLSSWPQTAKGDSANRHALIWGLHQGPHLARRPRALRAPQVSHWLGKKLTRKCLRMLAI